MNDYSEMTKVEREKELEECLVWLQNRMNEYDDKAAYQHDYKMASIAWNFMRARTLVGRPHDASENNLPELLRIIAYPSVYRKDIEAAADAIEALQAENAEMREAISRYCHNDCFRDSCEGNEDVGIPDCALARYRPLPAPPEKG
jgi:hypothetical protein